MKFYAEDIKGIDHDYRADQIKHGAPEIEAKHRARREETRAWYDSLTPEERAFAAMPAQWGSN